MDRPPRKLSTPLFDKTHVFQGFIDGFVILGFSMASYIITISYNLGEDSSRFIAFITLVLCNLVLIKAKLSNISLFKKHTYSRNNSFWLISTITIISLFAIFSFQGAAELFHFAMVPFIDLAYVAIIVLVCYLLMEFIKLFKIGAIHGSKNRE